MKFYTITLAAIELGVTRQAIHVAIKEGRLRAEKRKHVWYISEKNLKDFWNMRYVRPNRCKEGEVTVEQASQLLNEVKQRIYYLLYNTNIKYEKRNGMIFIQRNSLVC